MDPSTPASVDFALPSLPGGWQAIGYSVLADGALAIVGTDVDLAHEWRRDAQHNVLGDPAGVAAKARVRIWAFDGETLSEGPTFALGSPYAPIVDRFADGRWIVVRPLTRPNARVIAADGRELGQLHLGDGLSHLKLDGAGRLWVGWFDEGVFGNLDWIVPGHEWPPSSYGLVAFTEDGGLAAVAEGAPLGLEPADCYALNVDGDRVYACTYPAFPIAEASVEKAARWWPTDLRGARALAVSWPYVLAAGGYAEESNRVVLLRMDEHQGEALDEWRLPAPFGFPQAADLVDGRGDTLHIVQDGVWRRWRIGDFLGAAP